MAAIEIVSPRSRYTPPSRIGMYAQFRTGAPPNGRFLHDTLVRGAVEQRGEITVFARGAAQALQFLREGKKVL